MSNLVELTISESLKKLKNKEISPVELTKAYVEKMEENKKLNAYVTSTAEQALEQAKESEQRYLNGTNRPLEGIALGIKDLFCTKGIRTTACSNILNNFADVDTMGAFQPPSKTGADQERNIDFDNNSRPINMSKLKVIGANLGK